MVTEHTKFSPDWCFGLLKKRYITINIMNAYQCMFIYVPCTSISCRYRRTKIGRLLDLVDVVNSSATVNVAQVVGNPDGTVVQATIGPRICQSILASVLG